MRWELDIAFLFLGWLIGWLLKYIVFGLRLWDKAFHPERLTVDTTGPFRVFAEPFLGVFSV